MITQLVLAQDMTATMVQAEGRAKITCDCHERIIYDETDEVVAALKGPKAVLLAAWAVAHPPEVE